MNTYFVTFRLLCQKTVTQTVQAETPEKAIELAREGMREEKVWTCLLPPPERISSPPTRT